MKQQSYSQYAENHSSNHLFKDSSIQNMEQEKKIYSFQPVFTKESKNILVTPKPRRGRIPQLKTVHSSDNKKDNKYKDKKIKYGTTQKQKNPNQQFGHWSLEQNKRYHWFLQIFHSHFLNRSLRRMDRIFTSMAKFVETRQAEQCRSHHQKMEKKHHSFTKILLSLRMQHYQTASMVDVKNDIEVNEVSIQEPLLSQQALLKHQNNQTEVLIEQNPQKGQEPVIESDQHYNLDLMNDMGPLQYESSKNYFKIQEVPQRNNILDDAYEKELNFQQFF